MVRVPSLLWVVFVACCVLVAWRSTSSAPVALADMVKDSDSSSPADGELLLGEMRSMQKELRALRQQVDLLIGVLRHQPSVAQQGVADLPLPSLEIGELWDLSLREAISIGLHNAKVIRNLGGVFPFQLEGDDRVMLARDPDVSLEVFLNSIRQFVDELDREYWDLFCAYRQLETAKALGAKAQITWNQVAKEKGGRAAAEEAQAREQYFYAKVQLQAAHQQLLDGEARLRSLMGLSKSDGRLIRPSDIPDTSRLDLHAVNAEWLESLPEVAQQRQKIDTLRQNFKQFADPAEQERVALELKLERETARLEYIATRTRNRLLTAAQQFEYAHEKLRTTHGRMQATIGELETVTALYAAGTAEIDSVLDAQRRMHASTNDYHRSMADFLAAKSLHRFETRKLLGHHGLVIAEELVHGWMDKSGK